MADLQDVLERVAEAAMAAVYPSGVQAPSVTGRDVLIEVGWPLSGQLEEDLAAGRSHVSVFPTGNEQVTTRYFSSEWDELSSPAPTLLVSRLGPAAFEFTGAVSAEHNVGVTVGALQRAVRIPSGTSLAGAAALVSAALLAAGQAVSVTGAVLSISAPSAVVVVGRLGRVARELRRQEHTVRLIVWSPDIASRRALLNAVDLDLQGRAFLALTDGTAARLEYGSTDLLDNYEKAGVYRGDLVYGAEFATAQVEEAAQIVVEIVNETVGPIGPC